MTAPARAALRPVESDYIGIDYGDDPLVPDGEYAAVYVRHETVRLRMFSGAPRIYVHFRLIDPGPYMGTLLWRSYAARLRPDGRAVLTRRGELLRTLLMLSARRVRPDRVSIRETLRAKVLRVRVRTVTRDRRQREIAPDLRYSVVDEVLRAETTTAVEQ